MRDQDELEDRYEMFKRMYETVGLSERQRARYKELQWVLGERAQA